MPDPFSRLPLPLPIFILNQIEDLATLHHLLRASPAASAIFEKYYCEIVESILSNFVPSLQRLLRLIVSVRSQPAAIASLQAFEDFRRTFLFADDTGTAPLAYSTATPAAVRSLVATASHVHSLCAAFFEIHLERLNGVEIYCSNKAGPATFDDQYRKVPGPEHTRYQTMKCTAPSWVEEQRALRALWRIVVYFDLQRITERREDTKNALSDLFAKGPRSIWLRKWLFAEEPKPTLPAWEIQEIDTVFGFLAERSGIASLAVDQIPVLQNLPLIESESFTVPKTTPIADATAVHWQQLPSDLQRSGPGYDYLRSQQKFLSMCNIDGYGIQRPRNNEDFNPLRAFGMCIWDNEKLASLGLAELDKIPSELYESYLSSPHRTKANLCELSVRWRSLVKSRYMCEKRAVVKDSARHHQI